MGDLIDLKEEVARLQKEETKLVAEVTRAQKKLANERFVANAPAEVVNAEKEKLADYQAKLDATKERIATLAKEA